MTRLPTGLMTNVVPHQPAQANRCQAAMRIGIVAIVSASLLVAAGCAGGRSAAGKPTRANSGGDPSAGSGSDKAGSGKDYSNSIVRSELRERAIGQLLESSRSADPSIRANAAEAAQQAPARLDSIVASALKDENIGVRSVAAAVVGKAKLGTLSPSVRPLVHDPSPFVRASAIFGLRATGDDVDPSPLSTFLLNDPSPRIRSHAAYLLGEQGDRSALPMLRAAAKRTMPRASEAEVRLMQLQFAEAMVKLGDEAQIQSIRAALYPSRPEELEATALAVQILGQLKDRGSIDQLIFLSGKTDETGKPMPAEVRLGIAIALAQMGNRRGNFIAQEFWKNENPVVRAQAAAAFGATAQSDGLAFLDELLDDPSEQVRTAAAAAILRCVGVR